MKMSRIIALVLAVLMITSMLSFATNAEDVSVVYYVANGGAGDKSGKDYSNAFASINDAMAAIGNNDAAIIIVGTLDVSKLMTTEHTGMITIKGHDSTSEIVLGDNMPLGFKGPTTLSDIIITMGKYSHINSLGGKLVIGENVKILSMLHDGPLLTGTVKKTDTVLEKGSNVAKLFMGGAYLSDVNNGIEGNMSLTINGGTIADLTFGPDIYAAAHTGVTVGGNVYVTVNSGEITKITAPRKPLLINGSFQIIYNNDMKEPANPVYPEAAKGNYIVFANEDGTVSHTEEAGVFDIEAAKGYVASIDKKEISNGKQKLNTGTTKIEFVRNTGLGEVKGDGKYIKGYEDGTFLPQNNMTRAEAVTIITRLIADENEIKGKNESEFSDVAVGSWYYDSIAYLESYGILNSYSGSFLPNQNITRAEFVELIYKISKNESDVIKVTTFSDVPLGYERAAAIMDSASKGLVTGYPDGTFKPDGNITRAEVVTVINRFLKREATGNEGSVTFSDISGHWAKDQIIAASNESQVTVNDNVIAVWQKGDKAVEKFKLPEGVSGAKAYIDALNADTSVTAAQYVEAVDEISERVKSEIINKKSDINVTGTKYYISNSGDDANDGKSPEKPWKTLQKISWARLKPGDAVLLKRGDSWRGAGSLNLYDGVTYSAYGEGEKPILIGSKKNYADSTLWEKTDAENIYVCIDSITNAGIAAFDHSGIIGKYDELVGKMKLVDVDGFQKYSDLKNDLEFFTDLTTKKFYLYSKDGNPGERFKDIEIGERTNIVTFAGSNDITIDNICFKYTGAHAIGAGGGRKHLTIQNCTFAWIGGSILENYGVNKNTVRYGNAIEVYGSCDGYYVKDNFIYQIYDTGITHQYARTSPYDCIMNDVVYTGNLIEYCHWALEYYNQISEGTDRQVNNVDISYNICRKTDYGWGARPSNDGGHIRSAQLDKVSDFVISNNIFDRARRSPLFMMLVPSKGDEEVVMKGNIYIQYKDKIFACFGAEPVLATFDGIQKYSSKVKEENGKYFFIPGEE